MSRNVIRPRFDLTFLKAEPTPELLPAVATVPKEVDNSQLTKTKAGRIRRSRKRTSPSRSRSLFKRVTAAVEAEAVALCFTTKPDIADVNPDIDTDNNTVNAAGPKKNTGPSLPAAPSNTSPSQDDTSRHASPHESSGTPISNFITTDASTRSMRTPRPWPRRSPLNALRTQEIDNGRYGGSRGMRRCGTFMHMEWLRDHLEEEEEEDEGYGTGST